MTQVKLGDKNIPFIYQGSELLYPNPVKDGLVLWYDFKGMENNDESKNIARDLSGNGNNGTLQNFNYTNDSGYNDGLKFDNVDDTIVTNTDIESKSFTLSMTIDININTQRNVQFLFGGVSHAFYMRKNFNDLHASILTTKQVTSPSGNKFFYELFSEGKTKCQVTLKVDDDNKTLSILGNGIVIGERLFDESISKWNLTRLGTWSSPVENNLDGSLLSTQLYTRALTEEEIQHNYKIEKERWGL